MRGELLPERIRKIFMVYLQKIMKKGTGNAELQHVRIEEMSNHKNFFRALLAFFQAVIDSAVYWLSFRLVIFLWFAGKSPSGFTFEVKAFFTGTMLAVFYFSSLYSFRNWILWDEIKAILKSAALILPVTVLYLYSQNFELSRFILAAGTIIFIPLCIAARYVFRRILFALGILKTNIIILGAGKTGEIFAEKIVSHPFTACRVIGFLDDDPEKQGKIFAGFPVLGKLEDFITIYTEYEIDEAAVAISTASRNLLAHILDIVEFHVRQVHYIPDMYMLTTFSSSIRDVEGMPVIAASQGLMRPMNRTVKNIMDYVGAAVAVVFLWPFMAWAALKIKHDDGGHVLSPLERAGLGTDTFTMYKFRTSYTGRKGLTRTGKLLRRFYVDELPQLFNVLKGEMSLVGPMPLVITDLRRAYGEETARKICTVKPGITGFWQINERKDNDKNIRAEMNLYYIRNWSVWLDFVILVKTFFIISSHILTSKRP